MAAPCSDIERLRELVAPVQTRLLELIDSRYKQPGNVPGAELAELYGRKFGAALDPQMLTGQSDLKQMLNRRNIFPKIGVRGSDKKGGWLIYRVVAVAKQPKGVQQPCPPELLKVQENILELLRRAAHPAPDSGTVPHYSLDAGSLHERYGAELRTSFNFRNYGFGSLRTLIEACPKLAIVMKGKAGKNAMHIVARCSCCVDGIHKASVLGRGSNLALKRPHDEQQAFTGESRPSDHAPPAPAAGPPLTAPRPAARARATSRCSPRSTPSCRSAAVA